MNDNDKNSEATNTIPMKNSNNTALSTDQSSNMQLKNGENSDSLKVKKLSRNEVNARKRPGSGTGSRKLFGSYRQMSNKSNIVASVYDFNDDEDAPEMGAFIKPGTAPDASEDDKSKNDGVFDTQEDVHININNDKVPDEQNVLDTSEIDSSKDTMNTKNDDETSEIMEQKNDENNETDNIDNMNNCFENDGLNFKNEIEISEPNIPQSNTDVMNMINTANNVQLLTDTAENDSKLSINNEHRANDDLNSNESSMVTKSNNAILNESSVEEINENKSSEICNIDREQLNFNKNESENAVNTTLESKNNDENRDDSSANENKLTNVEMSSNPNNLNITSISKDDEKSLESQSHEVVDSRENSEINSINKESLSHLNESEKPFNILDSLKPSSDDDNDEDDDEDGPRAMVIDEFNADSEENTNTVSETETSETSQKSITTELSKKSSSKIENITLGPVTEHMPDQILAGDDDSEDVKERNDKVVVDEYKNDQKDLSANNEPELPMEEDSCSSLAIVENGFEPDTDSMSLESVSTDSSNKRKLEDLDEENSLSDELVVNGNVTPTIEVSESSKKPKKRSKLIPSLAICAPPSPEIPSSQDAASPEGSQSMFLVSSYFFYIVLNLI